MYPEKKEVVLYGVDKELLKPFVPEMKIRMNKGKAFDVKKITSSFEAYEILKRIYGRDLHQEHFIVLLLNKVNNLIGYYRHTVGSSSATIADIPMIVGLATKAIAQGVIISHNHPSGVIKPSEADLTMTQSIHDALKTVRIKLLEHIIFTNKGYYSFADEGALNGINNNTMITIDNIISEYPAIAQDTLPDALKQDEFEFIRENIDLYNEDETIKKYIETFIDKLNKIAGKGSKSPKTKAEPGEDTRKELTASDIPSIVKKFMPKFQQQAIIGSEEHFEIVKRLEAEIKDIPKDTREADKAYENAFKAKHVNYMDFYTVYAHFFHFGSDWFVLSWDGDDMLYCYVVLNGDTQMSEMGYVRLSELHENKIELDFFWDVQSLSDALHESYPNDFPQIPDKETNNKLVKSDTPDPEKKTPSTKNPKPVEKLDLEVSFIKRYASLNGKSKDKAQILTFLNSLQKAIIEKRIRKTSHYAKEITSIQDQLIKCYKQMKDRITIKIDDDTLENYLSIAGSETTMLSVVYIKQYIALHGKSGVKEKAQALHDRLEKAIGSDKININDPYYKEIGEIYDALKSYLGNKTKAPVIRESTLNGIMTWAANRRRKKKVAKYLHKIYETEQGLRGTDDNQEKKPENDIISSLDLKDATFHTLKFDGEWHSYFGDPELPFKIMIYGAGGKGKSTMAVKFADYLSKNLGKKVLFVANEEKKSRKLKDKLTLFDAFSPNLYVSSNLHSDLKNYDVVFLDSVTTLGIEPKEFETLIKNNPTVSFVYILQTNKAGTYYGKKNWEHLCDVVVRFEDGILDVEKNRFENTGSYNFTIDYKALIN